MATIKELVNKNLRKGYALRDAQNLASEEIIIRKIASSEMADHVTMKGGIVMYNITRNDRRVTQDIDFDLIRYSIDKSSIQLFIDKMNRLGDGFYVSAKGEIKDLHQEDYKGVRVNIIITDVNNDELELKLDIGVHTYSTIEQEKVLFNFESNDNNVFVKVNPPEQIAAEKLISLARLGAISTRYKDLYDLYYLFKYCGISVKKVGNIMNLFFNNSNRHPRTITELQSIIEDTLENELFAEEASKPSSKWIDVDYPELKNTIINFIHQL